MTMLVIRSVLKEFMLNLNTYIYFIVILYLQCTLSMNVSSYGTTFVDLKYLLNTTIDKISLVILFQSIGFLVGCCFGFLYKYINRQLTIVVTTLVFSIVVICLPYSRTLWQIYLCSFVTGIGYGVFFNSNNVWLLELFGDKSGPVLQVAGFVYGAGTILGPLMYQPYVTGAKQTADHSHPIQANDTTLAELFANYSTNTNDSLFVIEDDIDYELRAHKLKIPFLISGIIVIIGSSILLLLYLFRRYKINSVEIAKASEKDKKITSDTWFGKLIILISMFLFSFHAATDDTYVQFTATYLQYIPLGLSAQKSAEIVSYMGLMFSLAQAVSVFVSIKLRPQYMLAYHFALLLTGILIMYFGKNQLTLIWVGILIMSFAVGGIFPLIFAFMSEQIEITDRIGTVLNFASKIPGLFVPSIIGQFIDTHPDVLLYVMLINLIVCVALILVILYLAYRYKNMQG